MEDGVRISIREISRQLVRHDNVGKGSHLARRRQDMNERN